MTKMTRWIVGGLAVLAVSGLAYAIPAIAAGSSPGMMGMMAGQDHGHGAMHGAGSEMQEMHSLMAPLMSEMPAFLNGMVDERRITQEQADRLMEMMAQGPCSTGEMSSSRMMDGTGDE